MQAIRVWQPPSARQMQPVLANAKVRIEFIRIYSRIANSNLFQSFAVFCNHRRSSLQCDSVVSSYIRSSTLLETELGRAILFIDCNSRGFLEISSIYLRGFRYVMRLCLCEINWINRPKCIVSQGLRIWKVIQIYWVEYHISYLWPCWRTGLMQSVRGRERRRGGEAQPDTWTGLLSSPYSVPILCLLKSPITAVLAMQDACDYWSKCGTISLGDRRTWS